MRALGVVVVSSSLDLLAGVAERSKPMQIEALVAELPVPALDEGVLDRLARLYEAQPGAGALRPVKHRAARALGAVVGDDLLGQAPWISAKPSRWRATRAPDIETSTIWPGQNRLWSSTMFSTRKRRQSASWSLTKSSDQRCIGRAGTWDAIRSRRGSFWRFFVRTCKPCSV